MTTPFELRRWQVASTIAIVGLGAGATLLGLFRDGFYRDPEALVVQAYGQDVVTLAIVLPSLVAGLRYALEGSLRGYVIWVGALGYLLYTYAVYAVITEFNPFFLGYVALFGLSMFTFVASLLSVDAAAVKRRLQPRLPVRWLAGYFVTMAGLVALLWLAEIVPATLTGTKPASVAAVALPANVVHVLDLALVIPAVLLTARWLLQRRAWGYVLAGVLVVKLVSIGLAVLGMIAWISATGRSVAPAEVVVFSLVTLVGLAFVVVYLRSIESGADAHDRPAPELD